VLAYNYGYGASPTGLLNGTPARSDLDADVVGYSRLMQADEAGTLTV
jgi:hypothetical protein